MVKFENLQLLVQGRSVGLFARLVRRSPGRQGAVKMPEWRRIGSISRDGGIVMPVVDEVSSTVRASWIACLDRPAETWPRIELGVRAAGGMFAILAEVAMPKVDPDKRNVPDPGVGGPAPVRSRWPQELRRP